MKEFWPEMSTGAAADDHVADHEYSAVRPAGVGGAMLLQALEQQLEAHLSSLEAFQGATDTLTLHCSHTVLQIAHLLDAIHRYQLSYAHVLAEADLLRRIISDFAYFVHATGLATN